MSLFGEYAKYYNSLYNDKDYSLEVDFVVSLINKYSKEKSNLLDIGCGTGKHCWEFEKRGFKVFGIDKSSEMIDLAIQEYPKIDFLCSDAIDLSLDRKFDIVTSLFHVIGYFTENKNIDSLLASVYKHLKVDGLFIFDFWYGPAVLNDLPIIRSKKFEVEDVTIHRTSTPTLNHIENIVKVLFDINFIKGGETKFFQEVHNIRYFFINELRVYLEKNGFEILAVNKWLSSTDYPELNSWYASIVAKKISM